MKILITGGSGFLGYAIANELSEKYKVYIVDIKKPKKNKNKNIIFCKYNMKNYKKLEKLFKLNFEYVYHFAAISDIGEALKKPIETVKTNILATTKLLDLSLKYKVKRFIFASTIYVYSDQGGFYKVSKKSCELYIKEYSKQFNLPFTILRFGTVYGPSFNFKNNINKIVHNAISKKIVSYEGTEKLYRKIIFISDAAKISANILKKKYENKAAMITGKKKINIKTIMQKIRHKLNIKKGLKFENKKIMGHYISDPFKEKEIKNIIITPKKEKNINHGIEEVINFIKNNSVLI